MLWKRSIQSVNGKHEARFCEARQDFVKQYVCCLFLMFGLLHSSEFDFSPLIETLFATNILNRSRYFAVHFLRNSNRVSRRLSI